MAWGFWVQYFFALTIVALLLAGLYITLRGLTRGRVFASAQRRFVTVLESTVLGQHVHVHLVKVGARYLLIGGANGNVSTLAELAPEEVDAWLAAQRQSPSPAQSLLAVLNRARGRDA